MSTEDLMQSKDACVHSKNIVKILQTLEIRFGIGMFLHTFGHSFGCRKPVCTKLCKMFKRLTLHLRFHSECCLWIIFREIKRKHMYACMSENCPLVICIPNMLPIRSSRWG